MKESPSPTVPVNNVPVNNTIDLLCVLEYANIDGSEKEHMASQYGVYSFDDLIGKVDELKKAKLRGINRKRQQVLWKCVLWYQEFLRVHRRAPKTVELTEDALIDFETNDNQILFAAGESLKHVFAVLHSTNKDLQNRLADLGVSTFDDVIRKRQQLKKGTFGQDVEGGSASDIPSRIQKSLSQVTDWFDDFFDTHGRQPNLIQEFTERQFEEFIKRHHAKYNLNVEQFFNLTKIVIHHKEPPDFIKAFKENERKDVAKQIEELAFDEVLKTQISENLRKVPPVWRDKFLRHFIQELMNFGSFDTFKTPFVVAGETQSGKSAVKAYALAVGRTLKVPSVLLTKGVTESKELLSKQKYYAKESDRDLIVGIKVLRKTKIDNKSEMLRVFENGGTLVLADTKNQLQKLNDFLAEHWQGKKFMSFIDEADAMYRTGDRSQKFEVEFETLMEHRPCIRFLITATPVPALLALTEEGVDDITFWTTVPSDDYVGVKEMRLLQDDSGNKLVLQQGDLSHNTGVPVGNTFIPYSNDSVMRLYRDAAKSTKEGVLLLDISDCRVKAAGNVKTKSERVQQKMKEEGSDIAVATIVGLGIAFKLPEEGWVELEKGTKVCDALDWIEAKFTGPIFFFGFTLMKRGISYRSTKRVPTHMIIHMGLGHCLDSMVQVVGRGTFIGRKLLKANGHEHVTVLAAHGDWDMVQAHQKYVEEVHKRVSLGETVDEAMSGASKKLPANTNYKGYTPRRQGMRSKYKPNAFDTLFNPVFEATIDLAEGESERIKWYAKDENQECYRVMKICCRLWRKEACEFESSDIVDAFNDKYKLKNVKTCKTRVTKYLKSSIVKDRLIEDKPCEKRGSKRYTLEHTHQRLNTFLLKIKDIRGESKHNAPESGSALAKRVKVEEP